MAYGKIDYGLKSV